MAGQGDVARAKDDTRFYATGASITALTTDLSQYADNVTAGTSSVWEADSARWSESTPPLAIEVVCTANSTDAGYLYTHESAAAGLRISVAAGPIVSFRLNNAGLATLSVTVSGVAGTREDLVIGWSMEANPFTTGASDAYRSRLSAWNVTDGTYFQATVTHAVPADATGRAVWGASDSTGANAYTGVITAVRWSIGRYHPAAEVREDFIATTSAPEPVRVACARNAPTIAGDIAALPDSAAARAAAPSIDAAMEPAPTSDAAIPAAPDAVPEIDPAAVSDAASPAAAPSVPVSPDEPARAARIDASAVRIATTPAEPPIVHDARNAPVSDADTEPDAARLADVSHPAAPDAVNVPAPAIVLRDAIPPGLMGIDHDRGCRYPDGIPDLFAIPAPPITVAGPAWKLR